MTPISYQQLPANLSFLSCKDHYVDEKDESTVLILNGRQSIPLQRIVDIIVSVGLTVFTLGMIHVSAFGRELLAEAISGRKVDFYVRKDTIDSISDLPNTFMKGIFSFARAKKINPDSKDTLAKYIYENKVSFDALGYREREQAFAFAKKMGKHLLYANFFEFELNDSELEQLAKSCPNIKELNLGSNNNLIFDETITDAGIEHLKQMKQLEKLNLSSCDITDACIEKLPKTLLSLDLSGCKKLTDKYIDNLPQKLTSLNLARCENITDACINKLPKTLLSLNLKGCKKLTDTCIKKLPRK